MGIQGKRRENSRKHRDHWSLKYRENGRKHRDYLRNAGKTLENIGITGITELIRRKHRDYLANTGTDTETLRKQKKTQLGIRENAVNTVENTGNNKNIGNIAVPA